MYSYSLKLIEDTLLAEAEKDPVTGWIMLKGAPVGIIENGRTVWTIGRPVKQVNITVLNDDWVVKYLNGQIAPGLNEKKEKRKIKTKLSKVKRTN